MLRSAPALNLVAVADGVGIPAIELKAAIGQLKGRGSGARRAASQSYHHGAPRRRKIVLSSSVCPPFAARRAGWDRSGPVRRSAPGVAGWSSRSADSATAPRVVYAREAADPATRWRAARQSGCPLAIATRLVADHPLNARELAAVTPHWVVLAALVTTHDDNTRLVAAARDDLPSMLAATAAADDSQQISPAMHHARCADVLR